MYQARRGAKGAEVEVDELPLENGRSQWLESGVSRQAQLKLGWLVKRPSKEKYEYGW